MAAGVPAKAALCAACHGPGGNSVLPEVPVLAGQDEIPRVAGQRFDHVVKQLSDFKARRRTNDAGNMTSVSSTLSDADIDNLAHYIAGL